MSRLVPEVDPDGLLEYSVVFNDRSLNHMSARFQQVMRDISHTLGEVYSADAVAVVPGGGTWAMEAVARQFAGTGPSLVLRNGWFSYRWSQILEMAGMAGDCSVLKARPVEEGAQPAWAPVPLEQVLETIRSERPAVVFAPHVETASGMVLPEAYIEAVGRAVREYDGLFVLDCVASGALWVDMKRCLVDVLISAPQKGWSASPCAGLIMLSERARERALAATSSSFAADLRRWLGIMQAYEDGGHAYHATMPTDALTVFRDTMLETCEDGLEWLRERQWTLGRQVRELLGRRGFRSVAAEGFQAPGVVVCHTTDEALHRGSAFAQQGLQTAAGVPLMCDEPEDFRTFRVGLFGLEKLRHVDRTVELFDKALNAVT